MKRAASQRKIILDTRFIILFSHFILYTKYYTQNSLPCKGGYHLLAESKKSILIPPYYIKDPKPKIVEKVFERDEI